MSTDGYDYGHNYGSDAWAGQAQPAPAYAPVRQQTQVNFSAFQSINANHLYTLGGIVRTYVANIGPMDTASRLYLQGPMADPNALNGLIIDAGWILSFHVNMGTASKDQSQDEVMQRVAMEVCILRIVMQLNNNDRLITQLMTNEPDRFEIYKRLRDSMLSLAAGVKAYRADCKLYNLGVSGPLGEFGGPAPAVAAVSPQAQTIRNRALGQNGAPAQVQPVVQPQAFRSTVQPMQQPPQRQAQLRPAPVVRNDEGIRNQFGKVEFDFDNQGEEDLVAVQPAQPQYQPEPGLTFDPFDNDYHEPETVARDVSGQPTYNPFEEAKQLAMEEFPATWDVPIQATSGNSEINGQGEDVQRYGPVVRLNDYFAQRLEAKRFAPGSEWPLSIDTTAFARRCKIVNGVFTETMVPLETLTVTELDYLSLETSPTARRQAIELQERMDAVANQKPIIIESVHAAPAAIRQRGVSRPMELCVINRPIISSSIAAAEATAAAAAVAQTGKDINETDALSFFAEVIEYHGTYTDAELDSLTRFLEVFSIDRDSKGKLFDCLARLKEDKDSIPPRIWNFVNTSITDEVNKWLDRILRQEHRGSGLDSFADEMGEMYEWLLSKDYTPEYLETEIAAVGSEWYRAMQCLRLDRTGESSRNTRMDVATAFDLRDYIQKSYDLEASETAKRIEAGDAAREEFKAAADDLDDATIDEMVMKRVTEELGERKDVVTEDDCAEAYWLNHSVFSHKAHIVIRVPTNTYALGLTKTGYTHANSTSNPSICKLLDETFEFYSVRLRDARKATLIMNDGVKVSVIMLGGDRSGYLLEII